jgi:hypothetical protein
MTIKTQQHRTPTGRTSQTWFSEGYQAALADIAAKLAEGGEASAREWIANNSRQEA